ncbi:MAG: AMIN domain-containing protein [bacterium]|nr:AMIN domain-containing protein [bacterium]
MKWGQKNGSLILIIGIVLLPLALFAEEEVYSIKDAVVKEVEGKIKVVVSCSAEPQYRYFELKDPPRLVIDFLNSTCDWKEKVLEIAKENIYKVRSTQYKSHPVKVTRVVLDLRDLFPYNIYTEENQVVIDVERPLISEEVEEVERIEEVEKVEIPKVKRVEIPKRYPPEKVFMPEEYPTISMNIQDADILSVLRTLSEKAGVNIVPAKDVRGKVSLVLRNVPWERALDMVVKSHGYVYVKEDGIYRVGNEQDFEKELITKVFFLNYADASEMLKAVSSVLSKVGKAHVDSRTNSLVIIDTKTAIEDAQNLIERLDTKTRQVIIEAIITEMQWSDVDSLGIYWSASSKDIGEDADKIEVTLRGGKVPSEIDRGTIMFGVLDTVNFRIKFDALISKDKVEILSHPSIISLDNQEAKILAGKELPYVTTTMGVGGVSTQTVSFKEVGVRLTVTPKINPDGYITLKLHPEVSDSIGTAPNGELIIGTQEADTQILIKDGETVAIGGMITKKKEMYTSKVPVLGDFPIIGPLFRKTTSQDTKRNIFIFLTTKII